MRIVSILSVLGLVTANSKLAKLPSGRIVGGYEVQPQFKYPWIVSLQYLDEPNCGGTLYNEKTVITAAHCAFANTRDWTASIHRHDLEKTAEEEGGKTYNVTSRIIHPEYDINGDNGNDISIWILATEGTNKSDLLYDDGTIANSDTSILTVIGWGATGEGIDSTKLLEVKLPVFNITKCQSAYETLDIQSQFCAGYPEGGKDSCQGDSGGPIFSESDGKFTLVGVVSWGRGCAEPNQPGVYTRISTVQDFINQYAE